MTDIVERLLKQAEDDLDPGNALVREAVAEIEQWRSRFEKLQAVAFSRAAEIERLRGIEQFVAEAARHERDGLRADNDRLRRWVYATARSLEKSGLSLEEYNAITAEVCRALEQKP